jgi:protein phosphatase 2C
MMSIFVLTSQGPRDYMEDRHCAVGGQGKGPLIVGVFDGHGGHEVAELASTMLPKEILKQWPKAAQVTPKRGIDLFRDAFLRADEKVTREVAQRTVGSTACVAVIDSQRSSLWVANAGDSRCVLRTKDEVVQMSIDHKPGTTQESSRIMAAGGYVTQVSGIDRVLGNLSVSRSIGDVYMKPYVIPHPGISSRTLQGQGNERYLVLATDGLWDVLSSEEVCAMIDASLTTSRLKSRWADALTQLMARARQLGSQDNITIQVVAFNP